MILIVLAALVLIFLVGGALAIRRRERLQRPDYARHVAAADQALEAARAADKGWDRGVLEEAARRALARERQGWPYDDLHLVLVDDRPGVAEDCAHLVADGPEGAARVILVRHSGDWELERVE